MITLQMEQGSIEWLTARMWRLTASRMSSVITSTGKLSKSEAALGAIDKLIAGIDLANQITERADEIGELDERKLQGFIAHYTGDKFRGNLHTEHGHEHEPMAIEALEVATGFNISRAGLCIMGDEENGVVAGSPDGLIYFGDDLIAGCEVKSPCLATYYGHIADGVLPSEYRLQVHASMVICEVDSWHYASFFPGKPLFHLEVKRDDFTDTLAKSLGEFRAMYHERYERVMNAVDRLGEVGK